MRAIILAAGVGKRLAAVYQKPKGLLEFGGSTLLARHLEFLAALGLDTVHLVVGYQAGRIQQHVKGLATPLTVHWHLNADYALGSVVSLHCARPALLAGEPVLVMDADVLCSPRILERLVTSSHANCLLMDRDLDAGDEPVKICVRDGRMVEFRKRLCPLLRYDLAGESVGFFRFDAEVAGALATQVRHYAEGGMPEAPHEEALRDLLLADPDRFGYEDVTGEPWIEIDFPEDVERAAQQVLPSIGPLA